MYEIQIKTVEGIRHRKLVVWKTVHRKGFPPKSCFSTLILSFEIFTISIIIVLHLTGSMCWIVGMHNEHSLPESNFFLLLPQSLLKQA